MSTILLLTHTQDDGALPKSAREALSAALELQKGLNDATVTIGLIGKDVQAAADALAGCGASFLAVSGDAFGVSRYATDAAAAKALIAQAGAELILAPATSRLSRCMPGVAHRVGGKIDTHVSGLVIEEDQVRIRRWFYRQRMEGVLSRADRPWILMIDTGVFAPWQGDAGSAAVTAVDVALDDAAHRTEVIGIQAPAADAQTIRPDASVLFVAGAGWTKKQADGQSHVPEAAALIQGFLAKAKASLGSSKSLVDLKSEGQQTLSFMSHLNQVGQTGSTPRHPKGLSTCCHGEEPHVVGWRFINERRAVNLDPNCGWAQGKADVLYVADAFAVMKEVNAKFDA
jgi:electron transfer flavoprotein alpha subunit